MFNTLQLQYAVIFHNIQIKNWTVLNQANNVWNVLEQEDLCLPSMQSTQHFQLLSVQHTGHNPHKHFCFIQDFPMNC